VSQKDSKCCLKITLPFLRAEAEGSIAVAALLAIAVIGVAAAVAARLAGFL